jgi:glycosyltransferase involved in cell wall biosynthesis
LTKKENIKKGNHLVSVIIPTYNSERHLTDCIKSVLTQTYQNFELIVIDDGSTVSTFELIKSFKSSKLHYYYQGNAGAASARNFGLKKAEEQWIAFLDSDNL